MRRADDILREAAADHAAADWLAIRTAMADREAADELLTNRLAQVSRCTDCGEWRWDAATKLCQTCQAPKLRICRLCGRVVAGEGANVLWAIRDHLDEHDEIETTHDRIIDELDGAA